MTGKALPDAVAQAISGMHMSLVKESYKPLNYKSLQEMAQLRADAPDVPDFARNVVASIATVRGDSSADQAEYWARCATALILLGHGATDEAHDLVSPLSWPNELTFAYGPPVAVPEQVLAVASYVHALVHRREGPFESEFGMTGFSNADYWAGSALRSPEGAEALPLEEIRSSIMALTTTNNSTIKQHASVQQWMQTNLAGEELAFPVWDPRVLNELCSSLQAQTTPEDEGRAALREFAEQAVLMEMKVLLKYSLQAIGYEV